MSDNTPDNVKRHWHGTAGDRHEQLNVWTQGGSRGPASRAAWALTPEMMAAEASRRVRAPQNPLKTLPSLYNPIPPLLSSI